jgi:hypothetical protein
MSKPIQNISNNNSTSQAPDYVIVGPSSSVDTKCPGSFSE